MFKELYPLAQASPLAMMVIVEGEQMRITITQKKEGKVTAPLSLSVLSTPEELDAELPALIATAVGELAKPGPLAEQVRAQVEASKTAAPKRPRAEKKKSKPAAPKKAKPAKVAKAKPAAKPEARPTRGITPPGMKKSAKPGTPKLRASRPGADACIADYHVLHANYGDKLTRELFMKEAPTGRRFERAVGTWIKFVAAAQAKGTQGPPGDTKTKPLPLEQPLEAKPAAAPALATPPDTWPFPTTPKDVELGESKEHTGDGWDVYDGDGDYLSSITTHPEIGEKIQLAGRPLIEITSIDGRRVITRPATPPAAANSAPSQEAAAPGAAAEPGRIVITRTGTLLAGGMVIEVEENMNIDIPGHGRYRVIDFDAEKIVVELITREIAA